MPVDPVLVLTDVLCHACDQVGQPMRRSQAAKIAAAMATSLDVAGYVLVGPDVGGD